jgi:hypothetical protein
MTISIIWICAALWSSCRSPERHWPFPVVKGDDDAAILSTLSHRTAGVRSLYAVLSMSFETKEQSAVAQAVVYYRGPGFLRMIAFKDMLFSSRSLFDLVLTPERFSMLVKGGKDPERSEGRVEELPAIHPGFRSFQMLREAMFLPGLLPPGGTPSLTRDGEHVFVRSVTPSGQPIDWRLEEKTLGVERALVALSGSSDVLTVDYDSYREMEGIFLPEAFILSDPGAGVKVTGLLEEVELNPDLDESVFTSAAASTP